MADAFGTFASSSSTTDPYAGFGSQWGYYKDWEAGLQLLGHRYYDAGTGRFVTRDPIGYEGGINLYGYTQNNPIIWGDSFGLSRWRLLKEITINGVKRFIPIGKEISEGKALGAAKRGRSVMNKGNPQKCHELAKHAYGKNNVLHHDAHVGVPDARPHFQAKNGKPGGHIFYGTVLPFLQALGDLLDPTPVGLAHEAGKAFGDAVDPYVEEQKRRRQAGLDYWLSEE